MPIKPFPRFSLILCLMPVLGLYLLYLRITSSQMAGLLSGPPVPGLHNSQAMAAADFARFWYVGRLLDNLPVNGLNLDLFGTRGDTYLDWLYPPTMDVLAMVFAIVKLPASFLAWDIASLSLAAWLLRRAGLSWPVVCAGLASPAALQNLVMGQNGILIGALTLTALQAIAIRPRIAGVLAGLLCIKPPAGFFLPAILLHRRQSAALEACTGSVAAICILSLALAGWPAWQWYLTTGRHSAAQVLTTPFSQNFLVAGTTPFYMARSFYLPLPLSFTIQLLCSVIALALVWRLWRHDTEWAALPRSAATLCLASLVSPYGYFYDLAGFSMAMAAMFARASARWRPAYALLWLAPGYSGVTAALFGHIYMPLAVAAALALLAATERRGYSSASNSATWS